MATKPFDLREAKIRPNMEGRLPVGYMLVNVTYSDLGRALTYLVEESIGRMQLVGKTVKRMDHSLATIYSVTAGTGTPVAELK